MEWARSGNVHKTDNRHHKQATGIELGDGFQAYYIKAAYLHSLAVASSDYVKWEKSLADPDEKARTASVREILADNTRFELLVDVVQALTPVFRFLRLVDGYTPAVGKVYAKALAIDEHFSRLKDARADSWCSELHNFWIRDWGYMHVDMHSLGYCVDPEFHSQHCQRQNKDSQT